MRSASSAGSLSAASSARASSAPRRSHHSRTIHSGCEWRTAAPAGVASEGSSAPSRWTRRRTALTTRWPGLGLASSTASAIAACAGDAVEEQQLVEPELQRGAHARLEPAPVVALAR